MSCSRQSKVQTDWCVDFFLAAGSSAADRGQADTKCLRPRPRPKPKFWPRGHFDFKNISDLKSDVMMCCSRLGNSPMPPSPIKAEYDEFSAVRLEDIDVIATLGMGGFGRVELVCIADIFHLIITNGYKFTL